MKRLILRHADAGPLDQQFFCYARALERIAPGSRSRKSASLRSHSFPSELAFRQSPVKFLDIGRLGKVVVETGFCKSLFVRSGTITSNGN